jgi:hypothetical protein
MIVHRRLDEGRQELKQEEHQVVSEHMRAAYIILTEPMGSTVFFFARTNFGQFFDANQRK